jgi:eukaryotic-like serine/threonine-protein kinase
VDEQLSDLVGRRLGGRYRIESMVASGGMATVWRATDEVLHRQVAVKILHDRLGGDKDVITRFRREAVAAARLSHPAVVRVFDTGEEEGLEYIVMELCDGRTLQDVLERDAPLPPAEAVAIVQTVLHGLAHAHRGGVVHRDVKPRNILFDGNGLVKVTDFGIAKASFAEDLTTTGNFMGTARYLAPEQVEGGSIDARADLYATGIVLYELITGRPPFQAETNLAAATMRLTTEPPPPGALRSGIPRSLDAAVIRALARDPEDRYRSAEEMSEALERAVPASGPAAIPSRPEAIPTSVETRRSSVFRSWMLVPLILLLVAGLAVAGFFVFTELVDGGGGAGGGGDQAVDARPVDIVSAHDLDPLGDFDEYSEDVGLAFDGQAGTVWQTEGYTSSDLGGAKEGVGIVFDLGDSMEVAEVRLDTTLPGWTFELHGSEQDFTGAPTEQPLPSTDGEDTYQAEDTTRIQLEPVTARYVLVWITNLAPDGGDYRANIEELKVFAGS